MSRQENAATAGNKKKKDEQLKRSRMQLESLLSLKKSFQTRLRFPSDTISPSPVVLLRRHSRFPPNKNKNTREKGKQIELDFSHYTLQYVWLYIKEALGLCTAEYFHWRTPRNQQL